MNKVMYLILLVLVLNVGCKELESIEQDMEKIAQLKSELTLESPYSYEEQEKMSDYFFGLNLLVKKIDEHPNGKDGLSRFLSKKGLLDVCQKILLDKELWESIKTSCWKGEYFICSEDVLEFESSLDLLARNLEGEDRDTFLTSETCAGDWEIN